MTKVIGWYIQSRLQDVRPAARNGHRITNDIFHQNVYFRDL
jgi:hypothetical protein